MDIGISELIIPAEWSFGEVLENIGKDGYTALELCLRDEGYFSLSSTEDDLRALRDQAGEAGIDLVSVVSWARSRPRDLMTNDAALRKEAVGTARDCMRSAKGVGADTILLVLGSLTPDLFYDDAYRNALAGMREVAPIAEDMGVKVAIEYVWNKFLLSPMEFARFVDEVDSPNVGFYFDPGNMAIFGYPEHWVRICGRHIMATHMKDFKRQGYEWTPLTEGDVDFPAVMRELKAIGFDGPLISEVDSGTAPFAETARTLERIAAM